MEFSAYIAISIFLLIPISAVALWYTGVILIGTLSMILLFFILIFIVVPIAYRNSYNVQRALLFLNMVNVPVDFEHPEKYMLGIRNFYIKTDDNATLGVWHIVPKKRVFMDTERYDKSLDDGEPVFLYLHGNSGNRGAGHRIDLYKLLQNQNYHVIAFDYRSYGDSSPIEPTESGVVEDSRSVYKWLKKRAGKTKIIIWGHSLGTGIASHLVDVLESEGEKVTGLVLESPFNNISDEIRAYPLAKFFKFLPWFDYFFVEPMYENGLRFESDKHLVKVKTPILILHAEDDMIVPYRLGEKLYKTVKDHRGEESPIYFQKFNASEKFGHKFIYKSNILPSRIRSFVKDVIALKRF